MKVLRFNEFLNEERIQESVTSELHYLAKQANDVEDFIKQALDTFTELKDDKETRKYLSDMYDDLVVESDNVNEKKDILSSDELEDFKAWIDDGNAMKRKNGKWIEQTTQWRKEFTYDELQKFFKREFLNEVEKAEDDPCWDGYVQLGTKDKDGKEVPNCVPIDDVKESEHLFEGEPIVPMLQKMAKKSENVNDFIEKAMKRFKNKLKDGELNREWLKDIYKNQY